MKVKYFWGFFVLGIDLEPRIYTSYITTEEGLGKGTG